MTSGLPVRVSSLGTLDASGMPALADAVELGAAAGFDLAEHRSRTLLGEDLSAADLVVGFERHHVAAAVVEAGAPREKTFGAYELAELLARIEPPGDLPVVERAREAVSRADAAPDGRWATVSRARRPGRARAVVRRRDGGGGRRPDGPDRLRALRSPLAAFARSIRSRKTSSITPSTPPGSRPSAPATLRNESR